MVLDKSELEEIETSDIEVDEDTSWVSNGTDAEDVQRSDLWVSSNAGPAGRALTEAAQEANRQRELFAKVPTRSYSDRKPCLPRSVTLFRPSTDTARCHPRHRATFLTASPNSAKDRRGKSAQLPEMTLTREAAGASAVTATTMRQSQFETHVITSGNPGYCLPGQSEDSDSESSESEGKPVLSIHSAQSELKGFSSLSQKAEKRQAQTPVQELEEFPVAPSSPTIGMPNAYELDDSARPAAPRTTRHRLSSSKMVENMRRKLVWERGNRRRVMGGSHWASKEPASMSGKPRTPPPMIQCTVEEEILSSRLGRAVTHLLNRSSIYEDGDGADPLGEGSDGAALGLPSDGRKHMSLSDKVTYTSIVAESLEMCGIFPYHPVSIEWQHSSTTREERLGDLVGWCGD